MTVAGAAVGDRGDAVSGGNPLGAPTGRVAIDDAVRGRQHLPDVPTAGDDTAQAELELEVELLEVEQPARHRILHAELAPPAPTVTTSRRGRKGVAHQQSRKCQHMLCEGPSRERRSGAECRAARGSRTATRSERGCTGPRTTACVAAFLSRANSTTANDG